MGKLAAELSGKPDKDRQGARGKHGSEDAGDEDASS